MMTDKQIITYYSRKVKSLTKEVKLLAKLKLTLENALDKQKRGHGDGWVAVQKQLDKIDDAMDCDSILND
jgi:hypothetical protein